MLASRLWWVAFLAGLAAVLFGAIGAYAQAFAPWIGSLTTITAAVVAYGLVDRRKYLIASYAGMQVSLKRIKALDEAQPAVLPTSSRRRRTYSTENAGSGSRTSSEHSTSRRPRRKRPAP